MCEQDSYWPEHQPLPHANFSAWSPCRVKPPPGRNVLVWHRARPCCRVWCAVIGWWNGKQWKHYVSFNDARPIYQPKLWREIGSPQHPDFPSYDEKYPQP